MLSAEEKNELERPNNEGRVSSRVYSGTIGEEAIRSETSEVRPGRGEEGEGRLPRLGEQPASTGLDGAEPYQTASGIPAGLPAEQTDESRRLAKRFNRWVAGLGRGTEQVRFREVGAASLPDAPDRASRAIERATGTRIVVVGNLTPDVERFKGQTFLDGTRYLNDSSDIIATLFASNEWMHRLRRDGPHRPAQ